MGYTSIILQFALNDDINAAAQLVQTAINAAAGQLPKDMPTPPTYHETNPADAPILVLGLTSDTLPITTVDDYAESILEQKLSQVPGVGLVSIGGEQHPAIRVQFNPAQLAANGLDLEDVRNALTNVSVDQPKGSLYGATRSNTLQTNDQILTPAGLGQSDHRLPQWRADQGLRRRQGRHRAAGRNVEGLGQSASRHHPRGPATARRQRDQHGARRSRRVAAAPGIASRRRIKISVISDRTTTIRASVADVQFTLMLTIGLVVGVIFLFLRSVWATLIPAIAVPVSIIGTFARDVRVRLQPGQSVADGPVHRRRLRRG